MIFVSLLVTKLFIFLFLYSCTGLVHHKSIPEKDVQVKIGEDYVRKSFKMSYQNINTLNPSSKENTIVFNILEAKEYRVNIKVVMTKFQKFK